MFACPTSALIFVPGVGNTGQWVAFMPVSPATLSGSGFGGKPSRFANFCKAPAMDVCTPLKVTDPAQLSMQGPTWGKGSLLSLLQ